MNAEHSNQIQDDLQPVMDVLQQSPLRMIVQKAQLLLVLHRDIQKLIPAGFESYCHVMNIHQQTVILGVSNAAIATRIQFVAPDIMNGLHKKTEWRYLQKIQCRVCIETIKY